MSELKHYIQELDKKFTKLIQKSQELESENARLNNEISSSEDKLKILQNQLEELTKENETLKMTNALLGGDTYKKETKLKINTIIREIDHCVAQLSRE